MLLIPAELQSLSQKVRFVELLDYRYILLGSPQDIRLVHRSKHSLWVERVPPEQERTNTK